MGPVDVDWLRCCCATANERPFTYRVNFIAACEGHPPARPPAAGDSGNSLARHQLDYRRYVKRLTNRRESPKFPRRRSTKNETAHAALTPCCHDMWSLATSSADTDSLMSLLSPVGWQPVVVMIVSIQQLTRIVHYRTT